MGFNANEEDIEITENTDLVKDVFEFKVIKEDVSIEDNQRTIRWEDGDFYFVQGGSNEDIKITDDDIISDAQAVVDSIPDFLHKYVKEGQKKNTRIAKGLNKLVGDWKKITAGVGATGVLAAAIFGALGYGGGYDIGYDNGGDDGYDTGHGAGYSTGHADGQVAKDLEVRDSLEATIESGFTKDQIDTAEFNLFEKDIGDLSEELTYEELIQLQTKLVEDKALSNSGVADMIKNNIFNLILTNTTYEGTLEDLQAMGLSPLKVAELYGQLKAGDVVADNMYDVGKQHGQQDILNQTDHWNATHFANGYGNGTTDGKILGSLELYQQAVDIVSAVLSEADIASAEGNLTKLLGLYEDAIEADSYSLTKWNVDFTLGVAAENNTAADDALDRIASMGPEYRVTVDDAAKYKSWYANLTPEDADEIENVTGADVQKWKGHEYNFRATNTFGTGAVFEVYDKNDAQKFKVSQDLYNRMNSWETDYEGE